MNKYITNNDVIFDCGFDLSLPMLMNAIQGTNDILSSLPVSLYRSIDYKTTSSMVGCILCQNIAESTNGQAIVNPIEKGHPDIVPYQAKNCNEEQLRNYSEGLEVKCTVGNIPTGVQISKSSQRIHSINSLSWQAHHREVKELLGITYDFNKNNTPLITGVFYTSDLEEDDWGKISGIKGRNTKVCAMLRSGLDKMGKGWVAILDKEKYIQKYSYLFDLDIEGQTALFK